MRSLQEIDRDIAAMRKDEQAYAHTKGHRFSPIVDDELDGLYAERIPAASYPSARWPL